MYNLRLPRAMLIKANSMITTTINAKLQESTSIYIPHASTLWYLVVNESIDVFENLDK